jgi:hypothetical protein
LSTQRECCSDDNGKQALVGQFVGARIVGRAKIELSACPYVPRIVRRLFQRAIGASKRRKLLDDGLVFVTAVADPASSPRLLSNCWKRVMSSVLTGSALELEAD